MRPSSSYCISQAVRRTQPQKLGDVTFVMNEDLSDDKSQLNLASLTEKSGAKRCSPR